MTLSWESITTPIHGPVPEARPPWRDNAYVAYWDPASEVFGAFHASTSPNAEGRRARFSMSVAGRTHEVVEPLEPGTWTSKSIAFDGISTIAVERGLTRAELVVAPLYKEHDYTSGGVIPALPDAPPLHHVEQMVTLTGTVAVDGIERRIDGRGFRDRSWGYRDESASIREYFSISATFDDVGVTVLKFLHPDGSVHVDGHVFDATGVQAAVSDVGITRDASGLAATIDLTLADGTRADLTVRRRHGGFWIPMGAPRRGPSMSAYDEFVAYDSELFGAGSGLAEHGVVRQLF